MREYEYFESNIVPFFFLYVDFCIFTFFHLENKVLVTIVNQKIAALNIHQVFTLTFIQYCCKLDTQSDRSNWRTDA